MDVSNPKRINLYLMAGEITEYELKAFQILKG
ncbi:Uncharacterised protein [Campylobacter hyointestinalis subsp. hyointestinalis]|nr:Uncharacterised protein [Campylobacter hyointestinalis subsp. hyointestinalis]